MTLEGKTYWDKRLSDHDGMQATGAFHLPESWQKWMYKGTERAIRRLFKQADFTVRDQAVLDFGCGFGYFENFWEASGAKRADGVDISSVSIEKLQRLYPHRKYVCANLAESPAALQAFAPPDLVTAINVVFHIVTDEVLVANLDALCSILPPGGGFLFNDVVADKPDAPHVKHRSLDWWREKLSGLGLDLIASVPVFIVHNKVIRGVHRYPGLTGAFQYYLDGLLLSLVPNSATLFVHLAKKRGPAK